MSRIEIPQEHVGPLEPIARGLSGFRVLLVNVFGIAGRNGWMLVDAGLSGSAPHIRRWARSRFGDTPPTAILLTHAHFDHVGAIDDLIEDWNVPVYAHLAERPFLTGERRYPPPDPTADGGVMARTALDHPCGPIDLSDRLVDLPGDGTIPGQPEWRWIHTPGHTAGHVSLHRALDRTLLVGDAFSTTRLQAFPAAAAWPPDMSGPPAHLVTDWGVARTSVERLAGLSPLTIAPSHGRPMSGPEVQEALWTLAQEFDALARGERDHDHGLEKPTRA